MLGGHGSRGELGTDGLLAVVLGGIKSVLTAVAVSIFKSVCV